MGCVVLAFLFIIAFSIVMIIAQWRVFEKAGQPGWASLVPFYNAYILVIEIARLEILWFVLLLVPFANFIAAVVVTLEVAKKFGKDVGFGIGLILLPMIFYPMLAFGDARYQGKRRLRSSYDDDYDDNYDRPQRLRDEADDDEDYNDRRPRRRDRHDDDEDYDDRPRRRRD